MKYELKIICFLFLCQSTSLQAADNSFVFDVDGDGEIKPLTDGLLVLRQQFGFTGSALIEGAIGSGATRATSDEVSGYIKNHSKKQSDTTFEVVNKALEMKSIALEKILRSDKVLYGFSSTPEAPVDLLSLDADLVLLDSKIEASASARVYAYILIKSKTTTESVSLFVAIDHRASGIQSRAYLTVNGTETEVTEISRKPLEKNMSYHVKIDAETDVNNIVVSIAGYSALIPKSVIPFADIYTDKAIFGAYVKRAEVGTFVKASVDNIVLKRLKNGVIKTIIRDFNDEQTPDVDIEFNYVKK